MNEDKEGARYRYPSSLMSMLAAIHVYLLPYRELEGFARMFAGHVEGLRVPDYTTMWWRISRVKVELDPDVDRRKDVTIAVDSTGDQGLQPRRVDKAEVECKEGVHQGPPGGGRQDGEDALDAGDEGGCA